MTGQQEDRETLRKFVEFAGARSVRDALERLTTELDSRRASADLGWTENERTLRAENARLTARLDRWTGDHRFLLERIAVIASLNEPEFAIGLVYRICRHELRDLSPSTEEAFVMPAAGYVRGLEDDNDRLRVGNERLTQELARATEALEQAKNTLTFCLDRWQGDSSYVEASVLWLNAALSSSTEEEE